MNSTSIGIDCKTTPYTVLILTNQHAFIVRCSSSTIIPVHNLKVTTTSSFNVNTICRSNFTCCSIYIKLTFCRRQTTFHHYVASFCSSIFIINTIYFKSTIGSSKGTNNFNVAVFSVHEDSFLASFIFSEQHFISGISCSVINITNSKFTLAVSSIHYKIISYFSIIRTSTFACTISPLYSANTCNVICCFT